ncbi:hypothetical protein [Haloarchaeobius salinus]|uniref:hypothetical protein n=1 Tax=Haloarchaeobius salinus TaxID=1198298 RepID=UPI00210BF62B|nr:hypothetical protein [Haloarchaeobius salinus]
MDRRDYIAGLTLPITTCIAGCSSILSETEDSTTDSDGDGVPDKHDYAPRDPDVQSEGDVVGRTTTAELSNVSEFDLETETTPAPTTNSVIIDDEETFATTEPTTTRPTTTPTTTPTETLPTNEVSADAAPISDRTSHFTAYSMQDARVRLVSETIDRSYPDGGRLLVVAGAYPDEIMAEEGAHGYGLSDAFVPEQTMEQTVPLTFERVPDTSFYLQTYLVPGDATIETLELEDAEYLCETNRLRLSGGRLTTEEPLPSVGDFEATGFARRSAEGCYLLEFNGRISGRNWNANLIAYKSTYVQASEAVRSRDRGEYVQIAQESGLADNLATILAEEAAANGYTTQQEQVRFVIRFVQDLPYVPDDVSTGYDDYTKSVTETLVEGGGDCEDSAIMMASVLQAETFNYDCILIQPPQHMAVGVYGNDLPGTYWEYNGRRYYYLETTGNGWTVGELPPEYEGEDAYLYDV